MADIGRELLNLRSELKSKNLRTQWDRIETRLESIDEYEENTEDESTIKQLKTFRDKVAHDYDWEPPQDNIEHLRKVAPDWRERLITISEQYNEIQQELDARETLLQLIEQALSDVLGTYTPSTQPFQEDVEHAKEDAESLQDDLARTRTETSDITPELVRLFSDAKELGETIRQSQDGEAAVDQYIQLQIDEAREEAAFQRMKDE
jgi:predicted  nucleic acid-binding Zn-ribbon protein